MTEQTQQIGERTAPPGPADAPAGPPRPRAADAPDRVRGADAVRGANGVRGADRRARLRLLRGRSFTLLFAAQVSSLLGDQFYLVALPFFVLSHASAADLGDVLLTFGVGRLAALPLGGSLADRLPRTRVVFGSYLVKAVLLASLAVSRPHDLWTVMALTAVLGITEGTSLPSTMSILPSVVGPEDLPAANSLMSTATMGVTLLGPAIAGGLVRAVGFGAAFGVDAVIAVVAILAISRVRLQVQAVAPAAAGSVPEAASAPEGTSAPEDKSTPGSESAPEGTSASEAEAGPPARISTLGLLRSNVVLRFSVIVTGIIALTYAGATEVALPVYTSQTLHNGSGDYGLLLTAAGLGGVIGALGGSSLFSRRRPALIALSLGVLQGGVVAVIPIGGLLWLSFAALMVLGAVQTALNVFFVTTLQRRVPGEAMGKAMSAVLMAAYGGFPIAVTLAGHLISRTGPDAIFAAGGLMMAVGFASGFFSREYRNL